MRDKEAACRSSSRPSFAGSVGDPRSLQLRGHRRDPQCPVYVDSGRLLCANTGHSLRIGERVESTFADLQGWLYERAESARKRTLAKGADCARTDHPPKHIRINRGTRMRSASGRRAIYTSRRNQRLICDALDKERL